MKKAAIVILSVLFAGLCFFNLITPKSSNDLIRKELPVLSQNKPKVDLAKKLASNPNLIILNNKNLIYHKSNCKYGLKASNVQIITKDKLPKGAKPCKYCHSSHTVTKTTPKNIPIQKQIAQPPLHYQTQNIKIFLTDLTTSLKPQNTCNTGICKELLTQINNAQTSIDFAIYGYTKIPTIQNALEKALNRGVEIRFVFDINSKGENIYPDTFLLTKLITNNQADYEVNGGNPAIMHNKFFIFDKKITITGSANLSTTDMSGFNTNSIVMINSAALADFYTKEFEQMYNKKFHDSKTKHTSPSIQLENTEITAYFSPQDEIITKNIIPLIKNSKKYICMPVFLITHKGLADALIEAKNRGIDVKIIVDATNSSQKGSAVGKLRTEGVAVKVENYAGKVHSKSIVIDNLYTIIGSMNFSKSGESINDENLIVIKNTNIAIFYRNFFDYLWSKIPNKYLTHNVRAESFNSIGSCSDGIDNNFDGKVDSEDIGCIKK